MGTSKIQNILTTLPNADLSANEEYSEHKKYKSLHEIGKKIKKDFIKDKAYLQHMQLELIKFIKNDMPKMEMKYGVCKTLGGLAKMTRLKKTAEDIRNNIKTKMAETDIKKLKDFCNKYRYLKSNSGQLAQEVETCFNSKFSRIFSNIDELSQTLEIQPSEESQLDNKKVEDCSKTAIKIINYTLSSMEKYIDFCNDNIKNKNNMPIYPKKYKNLEEKIELIDKTTKYAQKLFPEISKEFECEDSSMSFYKRREIKSKMSDYNKVKKAIPDFESDLAVIKRFIKYFNTKTKYRSFGDKISEEIAEIDESFMEIETYLSQFITLATVNFNTKKMEKAILYAYQQAKVVDQDIQDLEAIKIPTKREKYKRNMSNELKIYKNLSSLIKESQINSEDLEKKMKTIDEARKKNFKKYIQAAMSIFMILLGFYTGFNTGSIFSNIADIIAS